VPPTPDPPAPPDPLVSPPPAPLLAPVAPLAPVAALDDIEPFVVVALLLDALVDPVEPAPLGGVSFVPLQAHAAAQTSAASVLPSAPRPRITR
jgi:hypothetical protein